MYIYEMWKQNNWNYIIITGSISLYKSEYGKKKKREKNISFKNFMCNK